MWNFYIGLVSGASRRASPHVHENWAWPNRCGGPLMHDAFSCACAGGANPYLSLADHPNWFFLPLYFMFKWAWVRLHLLVTTHCYRCYPLLIFVQYIVCSFLLWTLIRTLKLPYKLNLALLHSETHHQKSSFLSYFSLYTLFPIFIRS